VGVASAVAREAGAVMMMYIPFLGEAKIEKPARFAGAGCYLLEGVRTSKRSSNKAKATAHGITGTYATSPSVQHIVVCHCFKNIRDRLMRQWN
jgi:hypothetical protein